MGNWDMQIENHDDLNYKFVFNVEEIIFLLWKVDIYVLINTFGRSLWAIYHIDAFYASCYRIHLCGMYNLVKFHLLIGI